MSGDQAPTRVLHPAYKLVDGVETIWSRDRAQAWRRAEIVVRELAEAGMLADGELIGGKFYCRNPKEGTPGT